eukprot:XP_011677980.1 PREDICTED: N-acetylneuraminate lyase-like [Strongylocentrotus purpuratus]
MFFMEAGKHAEQHGASAISTLPPLFYKPSNVEGMVHFLEQVAAAAPKTPFFYYHNPSMVGSNAFSMETLVKEIFSSKRIPTLCGVKYTSKDLYEYGRCYAKHASSCQFMYGCDEQLLPGLSMGCEAFIGRYLKFYTLLSMSPPCKEAYIQSPIDTVDNCSL